MWQILTDNYDQLQRQEQEQGSLHKHAKITKGVTFACFCNDLELKQFYCVKGSNVIIRLECILDWGDGQDLRKIALVPLQ